MEPVGQGDAVHAAVALVRHDHIVVVVMRDGVHGAGRLAGVAANADLRVDQMLLQDAVFNQRDGAHFFSKLATQTQ
jgi:hypothetical protein